MLERVKKALRISHDLLNSEILDTIQAARSDMIRAGVLPALANSEASLASRAVVTFCRSAFCNDPKMAEGYAEAYRLMLDELRKADPEKIQEEGADV